MKIPRRYYAVQVATIALAGFVYGTVIAEDTALPAIACVVIVALNVALLLTEALAQP